MSGHELSRPSAFDAKLAEIYAGEIVPANHDADTILEISLKVLGWAKQFWTKRKLSSGKVFYESASRNYQGTLNGQDIIFSLGFEGSSLRERLKIGGESPRNKVLSLLMNHDLDRPAALIVPPPPRVPEAVSASVVVYDEVNNPEHLKATLRIVASMYISEEWAKRSYPHAFDQ